MSADLSRVREKIGEILEHEDFQGEVETETYYRKKSDPASDAGGGKLPLGPLVEIVAWGLLVVAIVILIMKIIELRRRPGTGAEADEAPPEELFGMSLDPEALPDDVSQVARGLVDSGQLVEALGLLYRGALVHLVRVDGVRLRSSHTEEECLHISMGDIAEERGRYFARLVSHWQLAAYAKRFPDLPEAHHLCESWSEHFGRIA